MLFKDIDVVVNDRGKLLFNELEHEYRNASGISNSDLSLVKQDPALVEWNKIISNSEDLVSSQILEGKLFHRLFLETDFYNKASKCLPKPNNNGCFLIEECMQAYHTGEIEIAKGKLFNTIAGLRSQLKKDGFDVKTTADLKECMKVVQENSLSYRFLDWERENAKEMGYDFLTSEEVTKYYLMMDSLLNNGDFSKLYNLAWKGEVSLYLNPTEFTYDLPLKGRVDMLSEYDGTFYIVDLKTCSSIDNIRKNIFEYGYYRQAAYYTFLLSEILDTKSIQFLFAFVETSPKLGKYRSVVGKIKDSNLEEGLNECNDLLQKYSEYLNRDKYDLYFAEL